MRFFLVILAVLLLAMMPLQTNAYLAVFESSTCDSKADTSASINQCISSNGVGLKFTCGSVTNTSATVTLTGYSDPTTCGSALLTTTSSAFNFGDCTSVTISGGSTSFTFGVKTDCSTTTTYSDASAKLQVSSVFSVAIAMAVMVAVSLMM